MLHTTGDVKTNLYEIDKQAKIYARLCEKHWMVSQRPYRKQGLIGANSKWESIDIKHDMIIKSPFSLPIEILILDSKAHSSLCIEVFDLFSVELLTLATKLRKSKSSYPSQRMEDYNDHAIISSKIRMSLHRN